MQRQRVVHAVAEEADRPAATPGRRHQAPLLLGRDPGEDSVVSGGPQEVVVAETLHLSTGDGAFGNQSDFPADLFGYLWVVTRGDLQLDAQGSELRQWLPG